ncbi:DUF397 domain-containing protein [Streptomyces sp. H34-S4]|uniref:DUF397 domain-containing protein n=1 Tax=Streptomyces sp. H34-S4 TaxID=2996463 RepID=UPI0022710FC7|nr:DUF397 domain-containing protein [Streptomyces sp. H34-S4]MCY0933407.1 DUF397 domain-containing protein [Streptomyces sp. H34-S4]
MSQTHFPMPDLSGASWRVSSYSGGQGECVEVADDVPGVVPVRDSTRPAGPVIGFGRQAWRVFVASAARP